jgi:hypothetical protein
MAESFAEAARRWARDGIVATAHQHHRLPEHLRRAPRLKVRSVLNATEQAASAYSGTRTPYERAGNKEASV